MKRKWIAAGLLVLLCALSYGWHEHWSCVPAARRIGGFALAGNVHVVTCNRDLLEEHIVLELDSAGAMQAATEAARMDGYRRIEELASHQDSQAFAGLLGKHGWLVSRAYPNNGGDRIVLDLDRRTLDLFHGSR